MTSLLHIDSSPMGDRSVTRRLTAELANRWSAANPTGRVIVRDVAATLLPPVDGTWVGAAYTPADARTSEQRDALKISDELLAEIRAAEHFVIGAPMHNFGIPSTLKLWIDQVARVGETFTYGSKGPIGLIEGKSATVVVSSGSLYGKDAAMKSLDFVEPYMRSVLGFLGVENIDFVVADGAAKLRTGDVDRETFLRPHLEAIRARFTE